MFSALISEDTSSKPPTFFRLHQWYLGKKNLITPWELIILNKVLKLVQIYAVTSWAVI